MEFLYVLGAGFLLLAATLHQIGRIDSSAKQPKRKNMQYVSEHETQRLFLLKERVWDAFCAEQYATARDYLRQMADLITPDQLAVNLAICYLYERNTGDALTTLSLALDTTPSNPELMALLADSYLAMGDSDEAKSWSDRSFATKTPSIHVSIAAARIAFHHKAYDEVLRHTQQASFFLKNSHHKDVFSLLLQADCLLLKAQAYFFLGRDNDAVLELIKVQTPPLLEATALACLAAIYHHEDDDNHAISTLQKLIAKYPRYKYVSALMDAVELPPSLMNALHAALWKYRTSLNCKF